MEDHRDEAIVIVAGYTNEMKSFINSNVGLQSRFTRYLSFEDYTDEELTQIFIKLCNSNKLAISKPLVDKVYNSMHRLLTNKIGYIWQCP
jgi:stage V sporulation protein K